METILFQMSVNQRVRDVLEVLGLSQKDFAILVGRTPSNVSKILNSAADVPMDVINKLNVHFGVSLEFLVSGRGDKFTKKDNMETNGIDHSNVEYSDERIKMIKIPVIDLDVWASIVETVDGQVRIKNVSTEKDNVERVQGVRYDKLTRIFRVKGNSMYPHYKDKCKILCTWVVDSKFQYQTGPVVASLKSGMLMLKRITKNDNGSMELSSDNELHGKINITPEDILAMWKVEHKTYEPGE